MKPASKCWQRIGHSGLAGIDDEARSKIRIVARLIKGSSIVARLKKRSRKIYGTGSLPIFPERRYSQQDWVIEIMRDWLRQLPASPAEVAAG